jgi:hypothetical protein
MTKPTMLHPGATPELSLPIEAKPLLRNLFNLYTAGIAFGAARIAWDAVRHADHPLGGE